jgi:hypothetical protein
MKSRAVSAVGGSRRSRTRSISIAAIAFLAVVALYIQLRIPRGAEKLGLPRKRTEPPPPQAHGSSHGSGDIKDFEIPSGWTTVVLPPVTLTEAPPPVTPEPSPTSEALIQSIRDQPYTTYHCQEVGAKGSSGFVDVLGEGMGTSHFCVLTNVCVDNNNEMVLINKPGVSDDRTHPFPRTLFWEAHHAKRVPARTELEEAFHQGRYVRGTAVVLAHAYCCNHPVHYMEPLPSLLSGLEKVRGPASYAGSASSFPPCAPLNLSCVSNIDWIAHIGRGWSEGGVSQQGWTGHALRIALGYPTQQQLKAVTFPVDAEKVHPLLGRYARNSLRCYEKVVVGGPFYDLFATSEIAVEWRSAAERYAAEARKMKPENSWVRENIDSNFFFAKRPNSRVILVVFRRGSSRTMTDSAPFLAALEKVFQPLHIAVNSIAFEDHDFLSQLTHSQEADIMIGMHGAGLGNMMFMRPGSSLIEINPILFFESRFYEMSQRLGIYYDAVTCTKKRCAFGGDAGPWDEYFSVNRGRNAWIDDDTGMLITKEFGNFTWPPVGYAGGCLQCNKVSCCTALNPFFYNVFRDSNVAAMPMLSDVLRALYRAGKHMGWDLGGGEVGFLTSALRRVRLTAANS